MDKFDQVTMSMAKSSMILDFCRCLSAVDEAIRSKSGNPTAIFKRRWPGSLHLDAVVRAETMFLKAGIAAGTPTGWGSALIPSELARAFASYTHPFTILGRLRDVRRVPFDTRVIRSTIAMGFGWVGSGKPAPVTLANLVGVTMRVARASGIVLLTDELVRLAAPGSEENMRDELRRGLVAYLDQQFVDPMVAAVANVSPASITNGLTPMSPSGVTADAAASDLARLLSAYANSGGRLESVALLMPSRIAIALALSGIGQFRNLGRDGGEVAGIPVVASEALTVSGSPGGGNQVIAVDTQQLFVADDGGLDITTSREGTVEALDNPTNSSATATPTTLVSLWQTDTVGVKVDRFINWEVAAGAVTVMDDVNWLSVGSPS